MECSTDFSDYEDISAYHPSRYDLYPSIPTQDISSESDSNLTPEGLKRAVQHSRRMIQGRPGTRKCLSDTETLDTLSQLPAYERLHSITEERGIISRIVFGYSTSCISSCMCMNDYQFGMQGNGFYIFLTCFGIYFIISI
eukprot:XP_003731518.1 PREDICTED: uncharacterized protein LOC100893364 isoform X1 [Strongylocentrotus purpuratus]